MASLFLRFPEGRAKALTLSYDDGVDQDIRLIDIMNRHGIKGTFNLNSGLYAPEGILYPEGHIHRRMSQQQATQLYAHSGQEVAVHALTHPYLEQLPPHRAVYEIIKDRENLEQQFGTLVRGMAYPFGTTGDAVVELLRHCGIAYARTTVSTGSFTIPTDWLRLPATCHHKSPELMTLAKRFAEDTVSRAPYLFYLWGHSYEFDIDQNWSVIETFCDYIGRSSDVWYATNIELYDYIHAYHELLFSANGCTVYNPTAVKLWFAYGDKPYSIEAGERITL